MEHVTSLIHIHVPRAAGSSLHELLDLALKTKRSGWELVSEHIFWGDFPPQPGRVFFVVLREPVQRVLSLAAYVQANPNHGKHAEISEQGFEAFLSRRDTAYTQFANGQVRLLAGRNSETQLIGPRSFLRSLEVLRRPDVVVAFSDDLEPGLRALGQRIGVSFLKQLERRNQSGADLRWSPAVRRAVWRRNFWDVALYAWARREFGPRRISVIR